MKRLGLLVLVLSAVACGGSQPAMVPVDSPLLKYEPPPIATGEEAGDDDWDIDTDDDMADDDTAAPPGDDTTP